MRWMLGRRLVVGMVGIVLAASLVAVQTSGATSRGHNGRIVYAAEVNGHYQLFTTAADGTGTKQVTRFADGSDAVVPDWSPDGTRIAFERDFPQPHAGVLTIGADGGDPQTVTPAKRLLFEGDPAYAPDGKLIVAAREVHFAEGKATPRDHGEIVVAQLPNRTGVREVTPRLRLTANDEPHYADPNFSPDGRWITFLRVNRNEVLQALFRVRVDGTGLRRLTPYAWDVALKHDWSPDGKLIVITTNADLAEANQSANLVLIRPDGSGAKQLTHFKAGGRRAYAGSFSPDGKQIVFRLEQGDKYALAVIGRGGKNMRLITKLSSTEPRFIDWGRHP